MKGGAASKAAPKAVISTEVRALADVAERPAGVRAKLQVSPLRCASVEMTMSGDK
jgi:hypothetical protein